MILFLEQGTFTLVPGKLSLPIALSTPQLSSTELMFPLHNTISPWALEFNSVILGR